MMLHRTVQARVEAGGRQFAEITVHGGYRPRHIRAHAGIPLRIIFRRDDDDACTERVVFSTPRVERRLASAGLTTVDLPPQPAGEIRFTCGMGRYQGRIELIDPDAPSWVVRLRRRIVRGGRHA